MPSIRALNKGDRVIILEICGWVGTFLFVLAYFLLSGGRIGVNGWCYQIMNLLGAILVGASVFYKHAWPALALEFVWASIALGALAVHFFKMRADKGTDGH